MIKKIVIVLGLVFLSGCTIVGFEKGLNYEKTSKYSFKHDKGTHDTTVTNNKNGNQISIGFGTVACGYYGLIGPLVFPIIPFWENRECNEAVIDIGSTKNVYIIYNDKVYEPSKVSKTGYYTFPLQTKSISDTATLVVEKQDGEKFEIPFRYQHTFSFDLVPGR